MVETGYGLHSVLHNTKYRLQMAFCIAVDEPVVIWLGNQDYAAHATHIPVLSRNKYILVQNPCASPFGSVSLRYTDHKIVRNNFKHHA